MPETPVIFTETPTDDGHVIGVARLNAPTSLNALQPEMIQALQPRIEAWRDDERVVCIILHGTGDRAFCAGGDVVRMYRDIRAAGGGPSPEAEAFFRSEYRLDRTLHECPTPIIVWGNGIVMGGGIGLLAGGSHRVVTPTSRLAMPEITIGLYPDVGATWLLTRMPGWTGLFLGLTGTGVDADDAVYSGLATHILGPDQWSGVVDDLRRARWRGDARADRGVVSALLRARAIEPGVGPLQHRRHAIDAIGDRGSVEAVLDALREHAGEDWFAAALERLEAGSPTSACVIFEQYHRGIHLSLAEAFDRELHMSIRFTRGHDFPEGVRALLVDKDRQPQWQPATLAGVTRELVNSHFPGEDGAPVT